MHTDQFTGMETSCWGRGLIGKEHRVVFWGGRNENISNCILFVTVVTWVYKIIKMQQTNIYDCILIIS